MRIDRLAIPSYRNLRSFTINFDETQATTVLLGRNGSGKSNLFEAIVLIFRELEIGGAPPFPYSLEYTCRGHAIQIDADPERTNKRLVISVDGKSMPQAAFLEGTSNNLRPPVGNTDKKRASSDSALSRKQEFGFER